MLGLHQAMVRALVPDIDAYWLSLGRFVDVFTLAEHNLTNTAVRQLCRGHSVTR